MGLLLACHMVLAEIRRRVGKVNLGNKTRKIRNEAEHIFAECSSMRLRRSRRITFYGPDDDGKMCVRRSKMLKGAFKSVVVTAGDFSENFLKDST